MVCVWSPGSPAEDAQQSQDVEDLVPGALCPFLEILEPVTLEATQLDPAWPHDAGERAEPQKSLDTIDMMEDTMDKAVCA